MPLDIEPAAETEPEEEPDAPEGAPERGGPRQVVQAGFPDAPDIGAGESVPDVAAMPPSGAPECPPD
jgi:hypothetical protein